MSDLNRLKMEDACRNLTSPLHQLVCGHFVAFNGYVNCRSNCKRINAPYEYNTVQGSVSMICEACIIDEFSQSLMSQYDEHFDALCETREYQQADVVQQRAMRYELMDTSGVTAHYFEFRRQREMELFDQGGMISRWVPLSRFVDQLTDPLSGAKIEGKEESVEDLFGSLIVTSEDKSTSKKSTPLVQGYRFGATSDPQHGWIEFDDDRDVLAKTRPLYFLHLMEAEYSSEAQIQHWGILLEEDDKRGGVFGRVGMGTLWNLEDLESTQKQEVAVV